MEEEQHLNKSTKIVEELHKIGLQLTTTVSHLLLEIDQYNKYFYENVFLSQ